MVSQIYPTGDMFAVYFAVLGTSIGLATPANSRLVSTVGMHEMVFYGAVGHAFFGSFLLLASFCTTWLLHFSGLWRCSL